MADNSEYTVDLDRVIALKGGRLPGFIVNWMKKFFHLDFINDFLVKGYEGTEFCRETLNWFDVKLDVEGMENLPSGGRYTFVSNHPLGGIDGVALGKLVGEHFDGKVRYLVSDVLMNIKGLAPICIGINKIGSQSRNLPKIIDDAFNSDNQMILFPAGLCSRKIDGKIQDIPWTKAFITKSIASGRDIVPIHFIARNSNRFYRIANICKALKFKFNFAMLFLPDEMYRSRHGTFRIIIGKPIPYSVFDSSKTHWQWAQWVRSEVYKL